MNRFFRSLSLLVLAAASHTALADDSLASLRAQVSQTLPSISTERRAEVAEKSSERLIDCPAGALERIDGRLHTVFPYGIATATVFDKIYTYVNLRIDTHYCL